MRLLLCVPAALLLRQDPACADTRDDVTALIHAGDHAAILQALANPDRTEQRQSFAAFQTARADAGAVSDALLAAHPDDPQDPAHALLAQASARRTCETELTARVRTLAYQTVAVNPSAWD